MYWYKYHGNGIIFNILVSVREMYLWTEHKRKWSFSYCGL